MRLLNSAGSHTALGWVTSRPRRHDWRASIIYKAGFRLVPDAPAKAATSAPLLSGDDPAEPEAAPRYASDFVPFKPRADFLVLGRAEAPGGQPVTAFAVSIAIAGQVKSLIVHGDRQWKIGPAGLHPGPAVPITSLDLGYTHAYGGPEDRRNPLGRGADVRPGQYLPNIEPPGAAIASSLNRPDPAGFAPIAPSWQPRAGKAGTYDAAWFKQRWPWFPTDFDWSLFNAAPADQQFPFFRGDELMTFENLNRQHPLYHARLPGLAARVLLDRGETGVEELPMRLDTVWVDLPAGDLVLVWRGVTKVASPRLRDVAALYAALEPVDAPMTREAHTAALAALREGDSAQQQAAARAQTAAFAKTREDAAARKADAKALAAKWRATADGLRQATGLEALHRKHATRQQDPMALLEESLARLREQDPAQAQRLEERLQRLDARLGEKLGDQARRPARPAPWTRERVVAALTEASDMTKAKLDGLDLSELDLSGADLRDATLKAAILRGSRLDRARLAGADLTGSDARGASFAEADLTRARFTDASLAGAVFRNAEIGAAVFASAELAGIDFTACHGIGADFTEAELDETRFHGAQLPRALFTGARAAAAQFSAAALPGADFSAAKAPRINMEQADLTNLRAGRGADLSGGCFAGATAPRSTWQQAVLDGADFRRCVLRQALFPEASLRDADFDRAWLDGANFDDACLAGAQLTNANLLRSSWERADLTGCRIEGSNLYGAGLLDATLEAATLAGSLLDKTLLAL